MNIHAKSLIFFGVCLLLVNSSLWKQTKSSTDSKHKYTSLFIEEKNFFEQVELENLRTSSTLQQEVTFFEDDIFHIKITDPKRRHFQVPRYMFASEANSKTSDIFQNGYTITDNEKPLNFALKSTKNSTMFSFKSEDLTYSDNYISYSYTLTTDQIFGYGERVHNFKLTPGMYTIWLNDTGTPVDDGLGGRNLYGHHPFILNQVQDGTFFGLLFVNTNAQDLIIGKPSTDGTVDITQKTIGGEIEYYMFRGDTPNDVIAKYQSKIGLPNLPPLWALGWHQCRWGYKNDSMLDAVVSKYKSLSIPLDTIWSDIDYMDGFQDFSVDPVNFGNLTAKINAWHQDGLHYVPIVDIGIAIKNGSYYDKLGVSLNAFIMSNYSKLPLINTVWPGLCYFPDFTNVANTSILWNTGLANLSKIAAFDGIWLDMNEPGMFSNGEMNVTINPAQNQYAFLPYMPGGGRIDLIGHSCSLNAQLYGDGIPEYSSLYNFKPVNPYLQGKITSTFLTQGNKRPFVLSRASAFGQGTYTNHWLGDNYSTYESMRYSIPGIFNFQMFGFSLVGADICGFSGDTTDALCSRWHDLGAFYPFARNHDDSGAISQEPWALGNLTLTSAKNSITLRYSLIRYMYTELFIMSVKGGTVFQPIFFQFSDDDESYNYVDQQFMIGKSLLVSPVLSDVQDNINAYFPNVNWNAFPSGIKLCDYNSTAQSGQVLSLPGVFNNVNLHMRGGRIIPYQNAGAYNITRTNGLLNNKTSIYINPDQNFSASGVVVFDDGLSFDTISKNNYAMIGFNLANTTLLFTTVNDFPSYPNNDIFIFTVVIFRGLRYSTFANVVALDNGGNKIQISNSYDAKTDVYTIVFNQNVKFTGMKSITFS